MGGLLARISGTAFACLAFVFSGAVLAEEVEFTLAERTLILSHGPWPVEIGPDPSNQFSGQPEAVRFGEKLFAENRLSRDVNRSCQSCHVPGLSFTDGLPRSQGISRVDRNSISLANLRLNRWFGWDGRSDTLWAQSIHPILDGRELGATGDLIRERLAKHADLAETYEAITGSAPPDQDPETVLANVGKFLAAYQETLVTPRTAFDEFRDALEAGDEADLAAYPEEAKRGLKTFVGKGNCSICHFGPAFTNKEFHNIGLTFFVDGTRVDSGRFGGFKAFRESRFNRYGPHSDEPQHEAAAAPTNFAAFTHSDWGAFRVPSLRNVARTAPYMYNGALETLVDAVRHYSELNLDRLHADGETLLKPLNLTEGEISDLVAFLQTLSGAPRQVAANP
jgi:cytochrome c peroxidase